MRVLFVVTGIGLGDSVREDANIQEVLRRSEDNGVLVACYDRSYDYFKDKYPIVKILGYRMKGREHKFKIQKFIFSNYLLPAFWLFGTAHMQFRVHEFYPDIVLTDLEPAGFFIGKLVGKKVVALFGFDPRLYDEYKGKNRVNLKMKVEAKYLMENYNRADLVVIPSFVKNKRQGLRYHYVSPILKPLPRFRTDKELMKKYHLKRKPILVMLGGSNYGEKLALTINKIAGEFDEDFIVFGADIEMGKLDNLIYVPYAEEVLEYMKLSKGVITLAGMTTLTEALVLKKPILTFPIIDHIEQQLNAYALRNVVQVEKSVSIRAVRNAIKKFLKDLPKLAKRSQKYDLKADGAKQVVNLLEMLVE